MELFLWSIVDVSYLGCIVWFCVRYSHRPGYLNAGKDRTKVEFGRSTAAADKMCNRSLAALGGTLTEEIPMWSPFPVWSGTSQVVGIHSANSLWDTSPLGCGLRSCKYRQEACSLSFFAWLVVWSELFKIAASASSEQRNPVAFYCEWFLINFRYLLLWALVNLF